MEGGYFSSSCRQDFELLDHRCLNALSVRVGVGLPGLAIGRRPSDNRHLADDSGAPSRAAADGPTGRSARLDTEGLRPPRGGSGRGARAAPVRDREASGDRLRRLARRADRAPSPGRAHGLPRRADERLLGVWLAERGARWPRTANGHLPITIRAAQHPALPEVSDGALPGVLPRRDHAAGAVGRSCARRGPRERGPGPPRAPVRPAPEHRGVLRQRRAPGQGCARIR
jgi:hypothetical protein